MEYFNIYNKYGEKTDEVIERNQAHRLGVCHRVVHLWLLNSKNQLLIQQRSASKESGAGLWYVSVGGHIESSESIEETLVRETMEELGLDIFGMVDSIRYLYTFKEGTVEHDGRYIDDEFFDVFAIKVDFDLSEIVMQPEEVQAVKYISYDEFKAIVLSEDKSFRQHKVGYKMLLAALEDMLEG